MSKRKQMSNEELEPVEAVNEPAVRLAELVAMRRIPDHHAHALRLYVGHDNEMKLSEWESTYKEFMSKPTDMSKEAWHEQFVKNSK